MIEERVKYRAGKMAAAMQEAQGQLYVASYKLQAFGILLKRQGEEHEGFTELCGLGMVLEELGDELYELQENLDTASFIRHQEPVVPAR